MVIGVRAIALLRLAVIAGRSAALFAQKKDDKKQDEAQKKEIQSDRQDASTMRRPASRRANDLGADLAARGLPEGARATRSTCPSRSRSIRRRSAVGNGGVLLARGVEEPAAAAAAASRPRRTTRRTSDKGKRRLRLRGHQLRARDGRPDADAHHPLVHGARRRLTTSTWSPRSRRRTSAEERARPEGRRCSSNGRPCRTSGTAS